MILSVNKQVLKIVSRNLIASECQEYIKVDFMFDEDWSGLGKTAVFYRQLDKAYNCILDNDNSCIVPYEVLKDEGNFFIGIYGVNGTKRITTNIISVFVNQGSYIEGQTPNPPNQEIYEQIISIMETHKINAQVSIVDCNTATAYANEQGDYAKNQGDYAKTKGDYAKNEGDILETKLFSKADKVDTYTKGEVDNKLNEKQENIGYIPEDSAKKGVAYGYAGLDENGKILLVQIPDSLLGQLQYQGIFDVSVGTYPIDTVKGHYYIAKNNGVINTVDFKTGDWLVYNGTEWDKVDNTDAVATVNGKIGNVVLTTADIEDSTDKRYITELEKLKIANSLINVVHDNSLSGSGTVADPLKVVVKEEKLASYDEWFSRKKAGTLDETVDYIWGE